MQGFFQLAPRVEPRHAPSLVPRCGDCKLDKTCQSPKMPPTGEGRRKILVVAEAPGKTEDERGVQLIGEAGQYLRRVLKANGVDLDRDCWKTNSLACRPPGNRTPTPLEIEYCRPNVTNAIKDLEPEVIILLGGPAVRSVVEPLWGDAPDSVLPWVGRQIPDITLNAWLCPSWHPSYLLRQQNSKGDDPAAVWFARHIEAACKLEGRPYPDGPPDYKAGIELIADPQAAADALDALPRESGFMVFDYEADRIKPDAADSRIVAASVAWGSRPGAPKRCLAYPWAGPAIAAHGRLMAAPLPKGSHNIQYEDLWTRRFFGYPPRNWHWCSQQTAHCLDNRQGVCSLKFQAYVKFGMPRYDAHIKPFLESKATATISRANMPNRIRELPLMDVLLYCGIDSALAYRLAWSQAAELGVPLI